MKKITERALGVYLDQVIDRHTELDKLVQESHPGIRSFDKVKCVAVPSKIVFNQNSEKFCLIDNFNYFFFNLNPG